MNNKKAKKVIGIFEYDLSTTKKKHHEMLRKKIQMGLMKLGLQLEKLDDEDDRLTVYSGDIAYGVETVK